ncbi:MAG: PRD domain-containing protein [Solobacterium sp.]|jgi:transcriptional antiterminator|nr:PRD domain-containing protein [Solobacterium sp.]MCH4206078.1 PRD domain-containing protein [Solobacterium sp.]MCH4227544.1 PRD domain-containing protein [Solobacterium sp.]MCH4282968.1 PRD domain-containing protein [Solobacterium sp.]
MKNDNTEKLIFLLSNTNHHLSGEELAKMLHVSKRSIRNYIKEINSGEQYHIESNQKGYLMSFSGSSLRTEHTHQEDRIWQILGKLLTADASLSIFDLADEMNVSESTILRDISVNLKSLLKQYDLHIVTHNYSISVEGDEIKKRKLIGFIASRIKTDYFTSDVTLNQLIPGVDVSDIRAHLIEFCKAADISINSYALNNLLIHLIIILGRISSHKVLPTPAANSTDVLNHNNQKEQILNFASEINKYCIQKTGHSIPKNDYSQIILLTALSSNRTNEAITLDTFSEYIDAHFLNIVIDAILDLNRRYDLPLPDNNFLMQFSIHVYNLYQRAIYHLSYPNPLAEQIKTQYAAVYDMAVYFCHKLSERCQIEISEDEIAFIAFHLGSWIEAYHHHENRIPFLVVTDDYYQMSQALIHRLHMSLGDRLHHLGTVSLQEYSPQKYPASFIITTANTSFPADYVVQVSPILTDFDIRKIEKTIDQISLNKKTDDINKSLQMMFNKNLYFRNLELGSADQYLEYLCNICMQKKLITNDFSKDVLLREHTSSTVFTNYLAVPHTISCFAKKSFICVIHNDDPIDWNGKLINFVLLIGIAEGDMKIFRKVFDKIVDVFSSVDKTKDLLSTDSYEQFIAELIKA